MAARRNEKQGNTCGGAVGTLIREVLGAFVSRLFTPKRKSLHAPLCFSHNPDLTQSHLRPRDSSFKRVGVSGGNDSLCESDVGERGDEVLPVARPTQRQGTCRPTHKSQIICSLQAGGTRGSMSMTSNVEM